jgi:twinkle protein
MLAAGRLLQANRPWRCIVRGHMQFCTDAPVEWSDSTLGKLRATGRKRARRADDEPVTISSAEPCVGSDTTPGSTSAPRRASKRKAAKPILAGHSSGSGIFVSQHFRLRGGEVEGFLDRHGVKHRRSGGHLLVEECPFCHPTRKKTDNLYKLYIEANSGVYFCHRCSAKGSWFSLRKHFGGVSFQDDPGEFIEAFGKKTNPISDTGSTIDVPTPQAVTLSGCGALLPTSATALRTRAPRPSTLQTMQENLAKKFRSVRDNLNSVRGISNKVLELYGVGADEFLFFQVDGTRASRLSYVFPMYDDNQHLVRFKVRAVDDKKSMKLEPKGGRWGLFGLNTVPPDADEVVITEGEFDAMAVYQATGRPAVSLPNGATSLPVSLLPALERFKKIYLWMDDDVPGRDGAQQFSKKLGIQRCYIVRPGRADEACKDANEALLLRLDLSEMLKQASITPHEGIATFADFREEIYTEIVNPLQVQGLRSEFLPRLNSLIKGHRRGELSIYSGHTGVGKTTLIAQMSLDYCMQGVPTLWGSFEVSNVRIAKLLMSQYYARSTGKSPVGLVENFNEWADKFETLPLYFMRYFGSNPIERVLHAMEYSNYVHDCSHILLDNLQFLTSGQGRGYDRFEVMDDAIERLRHYATSQNVHVSLVVHPRKENDDQEIQTASIFGTAKATQEADNLIILQRTPHGPVLDVRKNRFDGTLGTLNLRFCSSSRMFEERDAARRNTNALAILQQVARPTNVSVEAKALRSSSARATGRKHTTA